MFGDSFFSIKKMLNIVLSHVHITKPMVGLLNILILIGFLILLQNLQPSTSSLIYVRIAPKQMFKVVDQKGP